jgi:hypothetical protein
LGVPVQQATDAERRKKKRFIKFLIRYIPDANPFLLSFKRIPVDKSDFFGFSTPARYPAGDGCLQEEVKHLGKMPRFND